MRRVTVRRSEVDLQVTEEAGSADEAMQRLESADVDLAVVDISLQEGMSGIELIKHMQVRWPALKVLVVSRHDESLYAERANRAGAGGRVMKLRASGEIVKPIRRVLDGRICVSEEIKDRMLMSMATTSLRRRSSPTVLASRRS